MGHTQIWRGMERLNLGTNNMDMEMDMDMDMDMNMDIAFLSFFLVHDSWRMEAYTLRPG